ncbi:MAG: MBL fold metallo-hydrolase [Hyphomicrobiales bacterium]
MSQDFSPRYGVATELALGIRRIVAQNPSPMTFTGTNTYLVGDRDIAVIDPGPDDEMHLHAILDALTAKQSISHIFVTHSHLDHAPLARPLAERTGAPILAFGDAEAGRSDIMRKLFADGNVGGGEGVDQSFVPDQTVVDGQIVSGADWQLEVLHTPGHLGNHICLAWNEVCFTADHVMGWASSLISPPDGDLTDFMTSCHRMKSRNWHRFYPGHGDVVENPIERLDWLISHRQVREAAILDVLARQPANIPALTVAVYKDIPEKMLPAAQRNVLAHLIDLFGKSRVRPIRDFTVEAVFELRGF